MCMCVCVGGGWLSVCVHRWLGVCVCRMVGYMCMGVG